MPARSHVDLCMFIQILEVSEDKIPDALRAVLLSRDRRAIQEHINQLVESTKRGVRDLFVDAETNLHESVHIAQAITYPFLRWYSVLLFKQIVDVFKELPKLSEFVRLSEVNEFAVPAFHILDFHYYVWDLRKSFLGWTYKHELAISMSEADGPADGKLVAKLNAVDLIENAASLIQYHFSSGNDFPTWSEYRRWTKRNPAYTDVVEFVGRFIGDNDLAVRLFSSLVQVSFESNRPVQTFVTLLVAFQYNLAKGNLTEFVSQRGSCRWLELFDTYMDKTRFDEPELGNLLSKKYYRLDRYATSNFRIAGELGHPIIGHMAKLWGELERDNMAYRYAFTAPNGYRRHIGEMLDIFSAPLALIKFSVQGQSTVILAGDLKSSGINNLTTVTLDEGETRGMLIDFLAIFGVVRRFGGALMDNDFRLCHHGECPNFNSNFCNSWIFIPPHHEQCKFDERMESLRNTFDDYIWRGKPGVEFTLVGPGGTEYTLSGGGNG
jgi:hypothetical protein